MENEERRMKDAEWRGEVTQKLCHITKTLAEIKETLHQNTVGQQKLSNSFISIEKDISSVESNLLELKQKEERDVAYIHQKFKDCKIECKTYNEQDNRTWQYKLKANVSWVLVGAFAVICTFLLVNFVLLPVKDLILPAAKVEQNK